MKTTYENFIISSKFVGEKAAPWSDEIGRKNYNHNMNCQKCISYKRCKENKTLMDNCIWFIDEESILKMKGQTLKSAPFAKKKRVHYEP